MNARDATTSSNAARFHGGSDDVFARIASRYDLMCDLFSVGLHRLWKRRMARVIVEQPWQVLLDTATGTGDVILQVAQAQKLRADQHVIASDICPRMIEIARVRAAVAGALVEFRELDAHDLRDIPDASVDLCSMSFGLKICDRRRVMQQALRVLRPGGRFVVLEASRLRWAWLQRAYLGYMSVVMPLLGFIAMRGDRSAYAYLLRGVRAFPDAPTLAREMRELGFVEVRHEPLTWGIVAIHVASKPR